MSRIYDCIEPAVIDEKLLRQAVNEQIAEQQSAGYQKLVSGQNPDAIPVIKNKNQTPIDFNEVVALRLDYKNICRIDNLWNFTSITKLQLDNNILGEISGLEQLTGLTILDLSFNNIEKIEKLETLVNLEDLI